LFGGLAFTLYPLSVAYTNDFLTPDELVPMTGGLLMAYGSGAALGPLGGSAAVQLIGPNGLFGFIGLITFVLAVVIVLRMRKRDAPSAEDQGNFQVMPRTSPVASGMDPRTEAD